MVDAADASEDADRTEAVADENNADDSEGVLTADPIRPQTLDGAEVIIVD